jgi:hypothetical protein
MPGLGRFAARKKQSNAAATATATTTDDHGSSSNSNININSNNNATSNPNESGMSMGSPSHTSLSIAKTPTKEANQNDDSNMNHEHEHEHEHDANMNMFTSFGAGPMTPGGASASGASAYETFSMDYQHFDHEHEEGDGDIHAVGLGGFDTITSIDSAADVGVAGSTMDFETETLGAGADADVDADADADADGGSYIHMHMDMEGEQQQQQQQHTRTAVNQQNPVGNSQGSNSIISRFRKNKAPTAIPVRVAAAVSGMDANANADAATTDASDIKNIRGGDHTSNDAVPASDSNESNEFPVSLGNDDGGDDPSAIMEMEIEPVSENPTNSYANANAYAYAVSNTEQGNEIHMEITKESEQELTEQTMNTCTEKDSSPRAIDAVDVDVVTNPGSTANTSKSADAVATVVATVTETTVSHSNIVTNEGNELESAAADTDTSLLPQNEDHPRMGIRIDTDTDTATATTTARQHVVVDGEGSDKEHMCPSASHERAVSYPTKNDNSSANIHESVCDNSANDDVRIQTNGDGHPSGLVPHSVDTDTIPGADSSVPWSVGVNHVSAPTPTSLADSRSVSNGSVSTNGHGHHSTELRAQSTLPTHTARSVGEDGISGVHIHIAPKKAIAPSSLQDKGKAPVSHPISNQGSVMPSSSMNRVLPVRPAANGNKIAVSEVDRSAMSSSMNRVLPARPTSNGNRIAVSEVDRAADRSSSNESRHTSRVLPARPATNGNRNPVSRATRPSADESHAPIAHNRNRDRVLPSNPPRNRNNNLVSNANRVVHGPSKNVSHTASSQNMNRPKPVANASRKNTSHIGRVANAPATRTNESHTVNANNMNRVLPGRNTQIQRPVQTMAAPCAGSHNATMTPVTPSPPPPAGRSRINNQAHPRNAQRGPHPNTQGVQRQTNQRSTVLQNTQTTGRQSFVKKSMPNRVIPGPKPNRNKVATTSFDSIVPEFKSPLAAPRRPIANKEKNFDDLVVSFRGNLVESADIWDRCDTDLVELRLNLCISENKALRLHGQYDDLLEEVEHMLDDM